MRIPMYLLVGLLVFATGCDGTVPGIRFTPGESQKVSAQTADDIAKAAAYVGLPPGSPAATALANATTAPRVYAGEPRSPLDVSPMTAAAAAEWRRMERTSEVCKLRDKINAQVTQSVTAALSEIAKDIAAKKDVPAAQVIYRVQGLAEMANVGTEIASAIEVPEIAEMTPEVKARIAALQATVKAVKASATEQAARRPTVEEVADRTIGAAGGVVDWLESYGLLGLIPGGVVAGAYVNGARNKRKAALLAKQAEDSKWDQDYAKEQATREAAQAQAQKTNELLLAILARNPQP